MAVKKVAKSKEAEVKVEEKVAVEEVTEETKAPVEENEKNEVKEDETVYEEEANTEDTESEKEEGNVPEVEVTVEDEDKTPEVEVDQKAVEDKTVVAKDVRIKMQRDHKCYIGGELYDLKEGKCYNVPQFVKKTLTRAGVLAPL